MVRIVAALAWYDEPPAFLDRLVRSLAGVADELVALDGRWELMNGARDFSDAEQALAIEDAATAAGLDCNVHRTIDALGGWPSQVTKRGYLMALAAECAEWVLVIDGDEYVTRCDQSVRPTLSATACDVAVSTTVPLNRRWPWSELGSHPHPFRNLYRGGTTLAGVHNGYRFDGRWLNGAADASLEPAVDLTASLVIAHDLRNRGRQRDAAAREYRSQRSRFAVEASPC